MSLKDTLTNERLTQNFDNSFELVMSAIKEARSRIHSGEGEDNPHIAVDVMEDLSKKKRVVVPELINTGKDTPGDEITFPDGQDIK
jgi:signal peptidase I